MRLSYLSARGIAGVPDLEADLTSSTTGRPHDLVVIHGPAASGKTRLCELLFAVLETVGPYQGIVRAGDWLADPERGARAELGLWLDENESKRAPAPANPRAVVSFSKDGIRSEIDRSVGRLLAHYDHDPAHGKREYFPETRQRAWGARNDGTGAIEQSLLRSSKDPQKYSAIPRFLAELETEPARAAVFADRLSRLSPTARYAPLKTAAGGAYFSSRDATGAGYDQLSASETDAVLIAATSAMIGLERSIVVLDRPELHVPPDRLVAWVAALTTLGTDNQWFVATGDADLAASVDRTQRIGLGGRS